jgi:hypothetical protein
LGWRYHPRAGGLQGWTIIILSATGRGQDLYLVSLAGRTPSRRLTTDDFYPFSTHQQQWASAREDGRPAFWGLFLQKGAHKTAGLEDAAPVCKGQIQGSWVWALSATAWDGVCGAGVFDGYLEVLVRLSGGWRPPRRAGLPGIGGGVVCTMRIVSFGLGGVSWVAWCGIVGRGVSQRPASIMVSFVRRAEGRVLEGYHHKLTLLPMVGGGLCQF